MLSQLIGEIEPINDKFQDALIGLTEVTEADAQAAIALIDGAIAVMGDFESDLDEGEIEFVDDIASALAGAAERLFWVGDDMPEVVDRLSDLAVVTDRLRREWCG